MKKITLLFFAFIVCCLQLEAQVCTGFTSTTTNTTTLINDVSTTGGVTNISNLGSGLAAGRYQDNFATQAVSSFIGGSFDFLVAIQGGTVGCAIWVDWNGDLTFDTATETVFNTTSYSNGPFTGAITVPGGTANGDYYMRIMIDWNDSNPDDNPCSFEFASGRGEVEDYKVTITDAPACPPPVSLSANNVSPSAADLSWANGGSETEWEYALLLATMPAPTSGTVTAAMMFSASALQDDTDYIFYVRANCTSTEMSSWSQIAFSTLPLPPINDECDAAIALTVNTDLACGVVTSGTTVAATASPQPDDATGTPDNDVWFSFVATSAAHQVSLLNVVAVVGSSTDMGMSVFDDLAGCNMVAANEVGESDPNALSLSGLTAGNTYYVRVYGWSSSNSAQTNFDICIGTVPGPPANDECDAAIALTVNTDLACGVVTSGTTVAATASPQPDDATGTPDNDVWFSFVATSAAHQVSLLNVVAVVGSSTDMGMSVFDDLAGCNMVAANEVGESDPNALSLSGLTAGNTYYVRVYGWSSTNSAQTNFDICIGTVPGPPANDECDAAIALSVNTDLGCGVVTSATTVSATASPQPDDATGTPDNDVWFSFVATSTGHQVSLLNIVAVVGTSTDMGMSVFDDLAGCNMVAANEVGESDPNVLSLTGLTAGNTYYVRVYGWSGTNSAQTNFDICIGTLPPANDDCVSATPLTLGVEVAATNIGATDSGVTASCDSGIISDVWYSFVATATTEAYITTSAAQYSVFDACGGAEIVCNSSPATGLTAGSTYYIRINDDGSAARRAPGAFTLTVSEASLSTTDFDNNLLFSYNPNPVKHTLTLNAQKEISNVAVFNMLGQTVIRTSPNAVSNKVNMSHLKSGIYLVRVTVNGNDETVRIIKN